jgi:RNA polymerase sigma factor (TIGR02999 family)
MGGDESPITRLLYDAQQGDPEAAGTLFPIVYSALRALARRQMSGERKGHTLQPTALVHEAYLKLLGGGIPFTGKEQFLRAAAEAMRRILIDHAKARTRIKRGGLRKEVVLEECHLAVDTEQEFLLSIDEAICRLEQLDANAAAVVRMRFYIGLTLEEVAEARDVSVSTIRRDWEYARAFLFRLLSEDGR